MLVCGNSGISAEDLKSLKRMLKSQGFKCHLGNGGWLYFICEKENEMSKENWQGLLRVLSGMKQITPLYYQVGDRLISLRYAKDCMELSNLKVLNVVMLRGIRGLIEFSFKQRVGFIKKLQEKGMKGNGTY